MIIDLYWSECALSERFVARHVNSLRYVHEWRSWMYCDGKRWDFDRTGYVLNLVRSFCREQAVVAVEANIRQPDIKKLLSASTINAVERLARADQRIAAIAYNMLPFMDDDARRHRPANAGRAFR